MVERSLATRRNGRTRLSFHVRSRLAEVPTQQMATPTGYLVVSTPEATMLDLASRPADGGTDLDVSGLRGLVTASAPTMLDPHGGRRGSIDTDWGAIVNTAVEPDA